MKISIVSSVLNQARTFGSTIASIRSQAYQNVQHIVHECGSTDATSALLAAVACPGMLVIRGETGSLYEGFNRGLAQASGEVIGFMQADELFANRLVLSRIATILSDRRFDGVYGDLGFLGSDETSPIVRPWRAGPYNPDRIGHGWLPAHSTLYLRRSVFERHGVYDPSFGIATLQEAMLRYLARGRINLAYIPEIVVQRRI